MSSPVPYKIDVPQAKIDRLRQKLALADFPDELTGSGWDYGSPLSDIQRLAKAWETFDWRKVEKTINELPQFVTGIQVDDFETLDIHFVHKKSDVANAIPLLFVHGWPGSFLEVSKILPLLNAKDGKSPAFHIVAPSLPNFGFSQGVTKRGFGLAQYAETCHKLMQKLGYPEYVTQGGDWGFHITRSIGFLYPESCKASHYNMIRATQPTFGKNPILALQHALQPYDETTKAGLERFKWFITEGKGYGMIQSTKPQTLAYSLHDSPVGLLAWIYEKLHDWTDSYPWTDEEVLTWVSIYHFSTAGPGAAHRIYYETLHSPPESMGARVITRQTLEGSTAGVKLGLTFNPKELGPVPKTWARTLGKVVYEAQNEHGGHFYSHEHPELLVRDLNAMFGREGPASGVVKGKDGY